MFFSYKDCFITQWQTVSEHRTADFRMPCAETLQTTRTGALETKKIYNDARTVIPYKLFFSCKTIMYLETFNAYNTHIMH